jgi:hypothetical protein
MFPIGTWKNDGFAWQPALSTTMQECVYTYDEALDRDGYNNHLIVNLGWYPAGDLWIDDLKIEQIGLSTIEIVEWEKTNSTAQLWINAYPSSADNKVEWEIDPSSTGEGSIDKDGLLTATKAGMITVNAVSKAKSSVTTSKTFDFTALPTSIANPIQSKEITGYEYYSVTGLSMGYSKDNLKAGIYICKEKYTDGSEKQSKIYIGRK